MDRLKISYEIDIGSINEEFEENYLEQEEKIALIAAHLTKLETEYCHARKHNDQGEIIRIWKEIVAAGEEQRIALQILLINFMALDALHAVTTALAKEVDILDFTFGIRSYLMSDEAYTNVSMHQCTLFERNNELRACVPVFRVVQTCREGMGDLLQEVLNFLSDRQEEDIHIDKED